MADTASTLRPARNRSVATLAREKWVRSELLAVGVPLSEAAKPESATASSTALVIFDACSGVRSNVRLKRRDEEPDVGLASPAGMRIQRTVCGARSCPACWKSRPIHCAFHCASSRSPVSQYAGSLHLPAALSLSHTRTLHQ